jgi:hypothetical protein
VRSSVPAKLSLWLQRERGKERAQLNTSDSTMARLYKLGSSPCSSYINCLLKFGRGDSGPTYYTTVILLSFEKLTLGKKLILAKPTQTEKTKFCDPDIHDPDAVCKAILRRTLNKGYLSMAFHAA